MKYITQYQLLEAFKVKDVNPIQQEFMRLFLAKCDELGIQVNNQATTLQKNNNTWIINLSLSEVLKLVQESGWQQYAEGIRKGKADRLLADPWLKFVNGVLSKMTKPKRGIAHWIIVNDNVRQMISTYGIAKHSSMRTFYFEELGTAEKALGRFYNELVLVINNYVDGVKRDFEMDRALELLEIGFFNSLSVDQLKFLMKKYPELTWNQVFYRADFPQQTFKEITADPAFSDSLKHRVFINPNYADYDKVEDVLGDWE